MKAARGIRGRNKSFIVVTHRGHYYIAREGVAAPEEVALALLDLDAPVAVVKRAFEHIPTQTWVGEITKDGRAVQGTLFPPDTTLTCFSIWWREQCRCQFSPMKWD